MFGSVALEEEDAEAECDAEPEGDSEASLAVEIGRRCEGTSGTWKYEGFERLADASGSDTAACLFAEVTCPDLLRLVAEEVGAPLPFSKDACSASENVEAALLASAGCEGTPLGWEDDISPCAANIVFDTSTISIRPAERKASGGPKRELLRKVGRSVSEGKVGVYKSGKVFLVLAETALGNRCRDARQSLAFQKPWP